MWFSLNKRYQIFNKDVKVDLCLNKTKQFFLHSWHAEGEIATTVMTGKLAEVMFVRYYLFSRPLIESGEYSKLMVSKSSYYFLLCCT